MQKTKQAKSYSKKPPTNSLSAWGGVMPLGSPNPADYVGSSNTSLTRKNNQKTYENIRKKQIKGTTNIRKTYTQKLTVFGSHFLHITYKTRQYTYANKNKNNEKNPNNKRRQDNLIRTRNLIYQIVTMNAEDNPLYRPVFYTITFKENMQDIPTANKEFQKFIQRLNYHVGHKLKYLSVIEFQKRGAIHYHVVFFNLPFIDKAVIEKKWGHGFTRIETADNVNDCALYIAKYLKKNLIDKRLVGQKSYFTSKGLPRPETYYQDQNIDTILQSATLNKVSEYETQVLTITKYKTI